MKKLYTMLSIALFLMTSCATAGGPKQDIPKPSANQEQLTALAADVNQAKETLTKNPEWVAYENARKDYNAAVKTFQAAKKKFLDIDAKVQKLDDYTKYLKLKTEFDLIKAQIEYDRVNGGK